ncbi:transporter substrate-binding domain-containing protein [Reinekea sp.]|jgi:uncharacterized protein (TIGR02285 family)|uniref:substrate-binding periplasmic protein n=1 Tax=Reinekea sp. TaxID=1970455 RepID=UPI002A7FE22D|nr:transporter substrate-binding domain-containing protein [Reinekea sp.]
MKIRTFSTLMLIGLMQQASLALARNETISLHYHERPPYASLNPAGDVHGLTAGPVADAFSVAEITVNWINTPANRQLRVVQRNSGMDCIIGWFKNSEREQFARFSLPIYTDQPQAVIALKTNRRIAHQSSLSALFKDRSLHLLVKSGYSYGPYVDNLVASLRPKKTVVTTENLSMLRMLSAGRVDYFLAAVEEIEYLIDREDLNRADYQFLNFTELARETNRYLMCSQRVSPRLIERFNTGLLQR